MVALIGTSGDLSHEWRSWVVADPHVRNIQGHTLQRRTKPIWFGPTLQVTNQDTRDHSDSSMDDDRATITQII